MGYTFLRDQFVWNENVNDKDEAPDSLLCGLSRFLGYGIIETLTYYLIIMLIWDETDAQNLSQHQLNHKMVQNIKKKSGDQRFFISTVFKIYCFCVSIISIIPS